MRNTLITINLILMCSIAIGQVFDSIIAYSLWDNNYGPNKHSLWYEKQELYLVDSTNATYKLKYSKANTTFPPFTFYDKNFPQNISFNVDTNKVVMFYDTASTSTFLLFDFNVLEGDTVQVYTFANQFNWPTLQKLNGAIYQKIKIDSIRYRNFDFVGSKQVYYFHPGVSLGGDFWIRGLCNGYGGFLNNQYILDVFPYTTCIQLESEMIPLNYLNIESWGIDTINCNNFLTSINNPKLQEFAFSINPNPAIGNITIEAPVNTTYKVQLINLLGQMVYSSPQLTVKQTTINLTGLPKGVYIVQLYNEQNYISSRQRLVLQ